MILNIIYEIRNFDINFDFSFPQLNVGNNNAKTLIFGVG